MVDVSPETMQKLANLRKQAEKVEGERVKLERMAQDARKEAAELIPQLKTEMAEIDRQVLELQEKKSGIVKTLAQLGEKTSVKGAAGHREGGQREKMKAMIRNVGMDGTITNEDIEAYLETSSGYVGMMRKEMEDGGFLQRIEPGKYKVIGLP